MSDPPLSDINLKNKMAWVWTTLKKSSKFLKIPDFKEIRFLGIPISSEPVVSRLNNIEY